MDNPIEHRTVLANGVRFHVAIASPAASATPFRGPVIFCLHGFPEGWLSWLPLMKLLPEAKIFAPDLRGYPGSDYPKAGYDVFTLTDDIKALMEALGLDRPILLTHDWGGALGWLFAHRYGDVISQLAVVNCTHPRTLVRAVLRFTDYQTLRIPWVPVFQVPRLPEYALTTRLGRKLLSLSFTAREGSKGNMDRQFVAKIVERFARPADLRGAINYYRAFVGTLLLPGGRRRLQKLYASPITVPVSLIWGLEDEALSARVAQQSGKDAGCAVHWRPLPGIGHFVDLEAPSQLAAEVRRLYPVAAGRHAKRPAKRQKAKAAGPVDSSKPVAVG